MACLTNKFAVPEILGLNRVQNRHFDTEKAGVTGTPISVLGIGMWEQYWGGEKGRFLGKQILLEKIFGDTIFVCFGQKILRKRTAPPLFAFFDHSAIGIACTFTRPWTIFKSPTTHRISTPNKTIN